MATDFQDEDATNTINVVPLADLSLVLLIILMVMSPMVMSSMIKVATPRLEKVRAERSKTDAPDPLLIRITATGITLNNNPVESEAFLAEQIAIKLSKEPDRPVILAADDNIQVGEVVHLLDLAKQNGAVNISLLKGATGQVVGDTEEKS